MDRTPRLNRYRIEALLLLLILCGLFIGLPLWLTR